MGWTGGYVLLALLLAPYLRKFGKYTVPDFVGDRYYSDIARVVADLTPAYGADCPVAVVYRASWPDQKILRGTLADIEAQLDGGITRTALILVGPALAGEGFDESCLYAVDYDRRYRPQSADSPWTDWTPDAEGAATHG